MRRSLAVRRPLLAALGVLALSLLSCGREVTGPGEGVRFATGLSFIAEYPAPLTNVAAGAGSVVPFERVRILFRRSDQSAALDTTVSFPSNADSVALDLRVPLASSAPAAGEPLTLTLAYVNAGGDTVFRGGPVPVVAQVRSAGSPPPPPAAVPLTYTGVGSTAAGVAIAPDTVTVTAGDAFSFTATALDGQGAPIAGVPLVFSSLDPARATITAAGAGAGTTTTLRGPARIRVQLPTGAAEDTATLVVLPRAGTLGVSGGGGQTASPGIALPQNVSVRLLATDGQPLADAPVTVAVTTGGGSVSPAAGTTDANGFFNFTWTLGPATGAQSVTVSSPGVADLVVPATAVFTGATQLRITQQAGANYLAGDSITALLVEARVPAGTRDTAYADSVTLDLAVSPAGATITGVRRVRAVAGLARFDDFRLTRAGTYRLLVTAPGLNGDTSAVVTIGPRNATQLALVSGGGQGADPGAPLPQPVVVRAADGFGNGVAGVEVTFGVASGTASATADTTDADGLASVNWTLGPATGTQTLTVTAAGLAGSPLSVTALSNTGIVSTTLAPALDTLTAIGATRLLVATSRDGANTVVPGTYTWTSRDSALVMVNDSGRVTALANGAAWIVATEAGGTRDSARVVVEQRLATIRVTPDPRTIYLGASFAFAAQAVDGLGTALATQPAFTWTTASSAIASITQAGVATGVGLGQTDVRATAGAVTGTAQLTVRTPITRIAVVRDSATFVVSDTFSLAALDATRSYRAVAHDTLDAPMTGITFTWASSNPSVAALDSTGSATARARAVANGFTAIRASAQGVTGAAALTVAQVMTAIDLSPGSVSVAPTGSVALTARRRDANGFFIPGGSFTFASGNTGVATVSASGVVTGVAIGATTVTATSGTVTSAPATVTVANTVPPVLSFGRDTLAIGRSATNVSIPVYLSRPDSIAVTVNLAVADTFAFFAPTAITIPAGSTVGTATLNGRNAGTTRITATHAVGGYYAPDTAVLNVQSGVGFSTGGFTMLVNDERTARVRLTDVAPTGGTYITYQFGTADRVSISPDPAFIPAGQLEADVVIRGIGAGSTTITPVAGGVAGTPITVTTQAATLALSRPWPLLGNGQYRDDWYVYTPSNVSVPLPVALASSDSTTFTVTPQVTVPGGSNYAYFRVQSRAPGAGTVSATATGWSSPSQTLTVTTPKLGLSGGGTLNTTSPQAALTVYAQDSASGGHWRVSALAVTLSSSDTSVIRVLTPNPTIDAGQYYTSAPRVIPGGTPGTAWVRVTASGHIPDSVQYTVVGPQLRIQLATARVGAGQNRPDGYVYVPNNVTAPLVVRLASSDAAVAAVSDSAVIATGTNYAYFSLRGLVPGSVRLNATAAGHRPDSVAFAVTTPKTHVSGGGTFDNYRPPVAFTVYAADTLNGAHYATDSIFVSYRSTDTTVIRVSAADTIRRGDYYSSRAQVTFVRTASSGADTAWVVASAPGHVTDSIRFIVRTPPIQFSFGTYTIGRRQYRLPTDFYVYVPNTVAAPLAVTIGQSNAAIDSLSTARPDILAGTNYTTFGLAGLGNGVDTLIVSAPGYLPDTAIVRVTSPRLDVSSLPGTATTTSPPSGVTVYVADSLNGYHYALDTLLIAARSSNDAVIQPESLAFRIPRGAYYATTRVRYVGPGTARMFYSDSTGRGYANDSTPNTVTVTGPSLGFYNGRPVLGMRQYGAGTAAYVSIPNAIGAPLVVRLLSTDSTVASVPDSVVIPAGQTYAYVDIRGRDAAGTVQIQATAVGYASASTTQRVTAPRFLVSTTTTVRTTQAPVGITVQAADADGSAHYVWEPVAVTLASSNPAAATVDSAVVTIPAGNYYTSAARLRPVAAGTTVVTASDARVESYRYNDASVTVSVVTPSLALNWSGALTVGVGQWVEPYVYTPDNAASALTVALAHATAASSSAPSVTIPAGTNYVYHRLGGTAVGADTITYTAAGHTLVRGALAVGTGRVDGIGGWPANLTSDSVQVTLYARDQLGNVRNVGTATTFAVSVSGGAFELRSGVPASPALTSVTIPADAQSVSFWVRRLANGTGTATFTNATYATHVTPVVTVSGAP